MQRSEDIRELAEALAKAQSEFTPVPKTKTAKVSGTNRKTGERYEFTYKYADLADVLSMALPILTRHGISFTQPHVMVDGKLRVRTMLMHRTGQWMMSDGVEINEDVDPQSFGAESTYYRRYDGCSFIGVAPDEDNDAQNAEPRGERNKGKTTPAQATEKAQPEGKPQQSRPAEDKKPDAAPTADGGKDQHPSEDLRSQFFQKAKECGWSLGDIKKYIVKKHPEANGSTSNMTEQQIADALALMKDKKPEEFFKEAA